MKTLYATFLLTALASAQPKTHYDITDLGTLGGAYSYAYGINDAGMISGGSATSMQVDPSGVAQTAYLWRQGQMTNLGTLSGAACPLCNSEGAAASANGQVAVISETSSMDTLGEDFCGFGTHRQCLAAVWKNGTLSALPTLAPGVNSQVYWINNGGDAAGFSETGTTDATCTLPFQLRRFQAVKWSPDGKLQELQPLPGDTVGFAFGINENGEAVGASGLCSNTQIPPLGSPSGPHAVIWEKQGSPSDLGALPGAIAYAGTAINDRGDVVGDAVFPDTSVHPFLWTKQGGMTDLGVASGDFVTVIPCCGTINNRGDIVAFSCGAAGCRAMIRQNNGWVDLNTLVGPGTQLYLANVASINEAGQIAGFGFTAAGEAHAFLATPSAQD